MLPYGLILAGGKNSRMGFDKAQLNFHGTPQVDWLHRLLTKSCEEVFVSGNPNKIQGDFKFIEDSYERGGPMNGILSAFRLYPERTWIVIPVDMPNVNDVVIRFLSKYRDASKPATCFINPAGEMIEPFPVILESSAYPELLTLLNKGEESLSGFLKTTNSVKVLAPDARWFRNVNTPSQL